MMQKFIVTAIVLFATWTIIRRYAPAAWKTACTDMVLRTAVRLGWKGLASRLEAKRLDPADCSSGCATCGGCGPSDKTPAGEYVVLLDNLKRKNANSVRVQEEIRLDRH